MADSKINERMRELRYSRNGNMGRISMRKGVYIRKLTSSLFAERQMRVVVNICPLQGHFFQGYHIHHDIFIVPSVRSSLHSSYI